MGETPPPLPARHPKYRAALLRYWPTGRRHNRALLERITEGLRALPDDHPASHCRSMGQIRGYAHAHQEMAVHAPHGCARYLEAVRYVEATRL
ncbi:hypothetical protein [Nocardia flavorosea]|uniref:hypothetical protein n=1 Tax=Nocardia flavorosea TaxID=53429 RepID=UPI002458ABF5|nr:hypothetical protein [Nocardia flavorosea]